MLQILLSFFRDGRREFSARDKAMLSAVQPHLRLAYRHAELMREHGHRFTLLARGVDENGAGAILLGPDRRIRAMTEQARAWLEAYFPGSRPDTALPEALQTWLATCQWPAAEAARLPRPRLTHVVPRGGRRLEAHLLRQGTFCMILLREERTTLSPEDLAPLALSQRQAEVLTWLTLGKTDAEIAAILGISPRTVSHTLERIYRKLGVETRLAAVTRALGTARLRQ